MNELKSYTEYAVSTPTADFVIGFDFNYGEDAVNVTVDDVPATTAGYTVVYLNETTIRLSPSVPSGVVRLQRETDIDQTDHAYRAGAKFIAQTMDENFEQLRHSQQEVRDGFTKLADDTYEIIDTLNDVGQSAQDAADAAEVAAALANNAAAQVNDKVSYADFNNKPHNAMLARDAASAHPTSSILDASGETQQDINDFGGAKWRNKAGGYALGATVKLDNGDIVKSTVDGNVNDPNVDMTGWEFDDNSVVNIEKLRQRGAKKGQRIYLISANDGQGEGGGEFIATQKSGLVDDGGLIISSPNPSLFWVRVNYDVVTPEIFGAVGDDTADDAIPLQKTMSCGRAVEFDKERKYRSSKPIEMFTGQKIKGNGAKITKYTASKTGITGRTDPSGNPYDYDQDCAVVFGAWYGWYSDIDIENLNIHKESVLGADVGKVFFAPYISKTTLKSVRATGGEYGFYTEDWWMINLTRCEGISKCGFKINTGTSNTLIDCWSKGTKAGYSAFELQNMTYSSLINTCGEDVGEEGAPANSVFDISNSDISLIGCGAENSHAYNLVRIDYSWVNIQSPSFIYGINNKYRDSVRTGLIDISNADSVVTLSGGHINTTNTGTFADAARVDGAMFTYNSPLWTGVSFPDESGAFKINHTGGAVVDLTNFAGGNYLYNGRSQTANIAQKTKFSTGIVPNALNAVNLGNIRKNFYIGYQNNAGNGVISNGYPVDGFGGIVLNLSDDDAGIYSNTCQLALSANSNKVYFRRAAYEEALASWFEFKTTANTTVDANGFIKNASPIVRLYSDKIELNEDAKNQEITFDKLGVGDYLVKGSSGFSSDGWYIETPKDANGNVLFSVVYTTHENGDISIKTYKKKFDVESASIVADLNNPVDVSDNRWIDIRLNE